MSALPKAVQRQIEEANQLANQLAEVNRQQNQPQQQNQPPQQQQDQPPPDAKQNTDAQQPPPAEDGFEHKYRVLQGKYNAEMPRLQRQVTEQNSVIEQLRQQLSTANNMLTALAQNRVPAPGQGPAAAPAAPTKLVKDEEIEDFGKDLTDFIRRVAQETVLPAVDQKLQPVQKQVQQVQARSDEEQRLAAQTAEENMLAQLDHSIPDWRQQNTDPAFLYWLDQVDVYSGVPRINLLRKAFEESNAPRVISFFVGYRNEHAVTTSRTDAVAPPDSGDAPQRTLNEFVTPGTARAGSTGAQDGAGKRIWTQAEIKQFYDARRAGKYRSNPDKANELERDIVAAAREGRVR